MTQFIPNTFYGIQNFLDNLNACNAQNECSYTPKADYYEVDRLGHPGRKEHHHRQGNA